MENFFNAARSALFLLAFFASWTQAAPIVMDEIAAIVDDDIIARSEICLLYTSPSPRDGLLSRMPSSA